MLICSLILAAGKQAGAAGQLQATPTLSVQYNYNDNVDAVDPDGPREVVTATYLDYLLGLALSYKSGRSQFILGGYAGYEQYLTMEGRPEDRADTSPADYNFLTLKANAAFTYRYQRFMLEITDEIQQTRNLQEVFGEGTDALNYRYLYTHNQAGLGLHFGIGPKDRLLVRYQYDSLVFATPENDALKDYKPADSFESRGIIRNEYDFNNRLTGIVDFQYADRTFESRIDPISGQDEKSANYHLYMLLAGVRYYIDKSTYLEVLGGAAQRDFYDLSNATLPSPPFGANRLAYDLEDNTEPLANIGFYRNVPKRYSLAMILERGISVYGQNLFFTYTGVNLNLSYFLTPKLTFNVAGRYYQAVFDLEKNGREWLWEDDRTDNVTYLNVRLHYDILQKGGQGTLSVEGGYTLSQRDSSINGPDDYNPLLVGVYPPDALESYDTTVNVFYVQVLMLPTILIGN